MAHEPRKPRPDLRYCWNWLLLLYLSGALVGCSTPQTTTGANVRRFDFQHDTLAYANELVWEYRFNDHGKWTSSPREPEPHYTHHCFVVARSARQFFHHARFEPDQPKADTETYRRLIRKVVSASPRKATPERRRIIIPGYANLRHFSQAHGALLKAECGGAWQSYFQRGHWRMIFPFSRGHQERTSRELIEAVRFNRLPAVHLVCFPSLKINHAALLFDAAETDKQIRFATYDPNAPEKPTVLTYDRGSRTFSLPTNFYFPGGRVDVYEIYRGCLY
jgi:hypothetical protein